VNISTACYTPIHRTGEPLALVNDVLTLVERTGEKMSQAEIIRLKGEVPLMHDTTSAVEAEACFRTALDVARTQEAKWWELRTSLSLARLLGKKVRREEASAMLADIYNWFTKGFDTADLKEAKALLDQLNQ
jgi:predicted ATPase